MTKADIVTRISEKLGIEKGDVQATVESFMDEVKAQISPMGAPSSVAKTASKLGGIPTFLLRFGKINPGNVFNRKAVFT